jgi:hypothetical protein
MHKGLAPTNVIASVRPEYRDLVINLKTARALGATIPLIMQMTADEVIE